MLAAGSQAGDVRDRCKWDDGGCRSDRSGICVLSSRRASWCLLCQVTKNGLGDGFYAVRETRLALHERGEEWSDVRSIESR